MPLTDRDIERRLDRNDDDILELYTKLSDVHRTVKAHDQRFDAIDTRLDGIDGRLDGIDGRLDRMDGRLDGMDGRLGRIETTLVEVLRRLPEN